MAKPAAKKKISEDSRWAAIEKDLQGLTDFVDAEKAKIGDEHERPFAGAMNAISAAAAYVPPPNKKAPMVEDDYDPFSM